jgi:pentatricopeptide repeat protein
MVKEVWKTMREENCAGTRVTFVTLVDAFAKQGLLRDARDVIFEFEKLGHKPDLMIYNMLLNAYCRGGNHRKGPEILHEIRSAGLKPDSFSYCTLIYAFLRVRDFAKAYKYHEEMLRKGKSPDTKTYAKLRAILKVSLQRKQVNDQKANAGQTPRQGSLGKIPENAKSFWKRGKRPSRRLLR